MRRDRLWRHSARLVSALAPACTHDALSDRHARPTSLGEPPDESYYEAGGDVPGEQLRETIETEEDYALDRVLLPARVPRALRSVPLAMDPIEILHFRPVPAGDHPRPLILMSPILGNTIFVVDSFARGLARRGIHAAIVQRKDLAFHPRASLEVAEGEVRLVVMRSRQALDALIRRPDVDPARLGTFGASAGAIVSSMLGGADRRFGAHFWMLAGGPLGDVMIDTVEAEYCGYLREVLRSSTRTRETLRTELRTKFRTDPLRLAPRVDRSKVLLVLARFDRSVPYRHGLALWRALGRPERIVSPFGHYTTFLLLPWLRRRAFEYFEGHFG